jgi:hypothetical protein
VIAARRFEALNEDVLHHPRDDLPEGHVSVSIAAIAEAARQLDDEAWMRVEELALDAKHTLQGIAAAFELHDVQVWSTDDVANVAGVLMRLLPDERPELLFRVIQAWQSARGGTVLEEDGLVGEERGNA